MTESVDPGRIPVGGRIEATFRVADLEHRSYGGAECAVVTFANARGRLASAPFWGEDRARLAGIARGDAVHVAGEVSSYRDRRQLRVLSIRRLERDAVDWRELLPSIPDTARYWERLDRWRSQIRAAALRRTLDLFFEDPEFRRAFESAPASTAGHHARLGGLLQHTWEVAETARNMASFAGGDVDLVTAGALLHDIGKVEAYRWDTGFEMTERGALLGHVAIGALMLVSRLADANPPPCTDRDRTVLLHLILSHHGSLELGAAVPPMTLEATILHHADDASAKAASMADALADAENFAPGSDLSLRGVWQLDRRRVWRGRPDWSAGEADPAPADGLVLAQRGCGP